MVRDLIDIRMDAWEVNHYFDSSGVDLFLSFTSCRSVRYCIHSCNWWSDSKNRIDRQSTINRQLDWIGSKKKGTVAFTGCAHNGEGAKDLSMHVY